MISKSQAEKLAKLSEAFTPHQPIHIPEFLAGRQGILYRVTDAVNTEGLHIVLFGDRGIGKTSVARVLQLHLQQPHKEGRRVLYVSCSSEDDYSTIWRKVCQEILITQTQIGLAQHGATAITGRLSPDEPFNYPNDVRLFLISLPNPTVIIIDEFDRTNPNSNVRRLMADTIKSFSDLLVPSTFPDHDDGLYQSKYNTMILRPSSWSIDE